MRVLGLCLLLCIAAADPPLQRLSRQTQYTRGNGHLTPENDALLESHGSARSNKIEIEQNSQHELTEADGNVVSEDVSVGISANVVDAKHSDKDTTQEQKLQDSATQTVAAAARATTTTTTTAITSTPAASSPKPAESKPSPASTPEWSDAALVDDLDKERQSADEFTRFIRVPNTKSIGKKISSSKAQRPQPQPTRHVVPTSFLQYGPPVYYYPVHPAVLFQQQQHFQQQFLQQQQKQRAAQGRQEASASDAADAQAAATEQGPGDFGTPLYDSRAFGSYDGMGDSYYGGGGYFPYGGDAGYAGYGYPAVPGYPVYRSPYDARADFAPPPPPPMPVNLPLPPYILPTADKV